MSWGRHRTRSNHYTAWFFTFFPSGIFHLAFFKFTPLHSRAPTLQATAGQLPFEAGVGLRGQKARKLQADLRKQEAGHNCCIVHHSFRIKKGFQGHNGQNSESLCLHHAGSVFEAEAGWVAGQRRRSAQGRQRLKFHFSESSRFPNVGQHICVHKVSDWCILSCLYTLIFWNICFGHESWVWFRLDTPKFLVRQFAFRDVSILPVGTFGSF